jgi:parallel beta-helix repeat protein
MKKAFRSFLSIAMVSIVAYCLFVSSAICDCYNYYSFEKGSPKPEYVSNEGWNIANPGHNGDNSIVSQTSTNTIKSFSIIVNNLTNDVSVSFWYSFKNADRSGKDKRLLFRVDDSSYFLEYGDCWQPFSTTAKGAMRHTLTWTFFSGSNRNDSCRIDDLCIREVSCGECPEGTAGIVQSIELQASDTTQTTPSLPVEPTNVSNATIVQHNLPESLSQTNANDDDAKEYYVMNRNHKQAPNIFPTIQKAINSVPKGSTIKVIDLGFPYCEDVVVNKSIRLISENFANITPTKIGCLIKADDVTVSGFKVNGGIVGIQLEKEFQRCNISYNILCGNANGILAEKTIDSKVTWNQFKNINWNAINLNGSINVTVANNSIMDCGDYGIYMENSNDNKIIENDIKQTRQEGICLLYCERNSIINNTFEDISNCDILDVFGSGNLNGLLCNNVNCGDEYKNCKCCS